MTNEKEFDEMLESIGYKLYSLRHLRREKITTVASVLGVTHPVISQIENGRYPGISLKLLCKMAAYYSISVHELIMKS